MDLAFAVGKCAVGRPFAFVYAWIRPSPLAVAVPALTNAAQADCAVGGPRLKRSCRDDNSQSVPARAGLRSCHAYKKKAAGVSSAAKRKVALPGG